MAFGKGETERFKNRSYGKYEVAISPASRFSDLPIASVVDTVRGAFEAGRDLILTAETGSGKTTVLPLELWQDDWLRGQSVVVLEPRRLSAVAAAQRMAYNVGEKPGDRVGWSVSLDRRVGPRTRLTVMTEGILLQALRNDPELKGIGLVLFDEFHERTVLGDLVLALCRDVQKHLRPDLRLGILSATLDVDSVSRALNRPHVVHSPGRTFPVDVEFRPARDPQKWIDHVCVSVVEAWSKFDGTVLVFLPGWKEINTVARALERQARAAGEIVSLLHSSIDWSKQTELVSKRNGEKRRTILSSSIAETSLTIPDVRLVIDSGWSRVLEYDVRRGLNRLETIRVSRASALQRQGRAGRTQAGACWKLWNSNEALLEQTPPEIVRADLASLVLDCAAWGARSPGDLDWVTTPPIAAWSKARELLTDFGALDEAGNATEHGRQMQRLGFEPRWAHTILSERRYRALAVAVSAVLHEKDFLADSNDLEVSTRVQALFGSVAAVDRNAWERVREVYRKGLDLVGVDEVVPPTSTELQRSVARLLASAYPDRIAKKVENGTFQLTGGRLVAVRGDLGRADWLVVPDLDAGSTKGQAYLAQEIDRPTIEELYLERMKTVDRWTWDGWKAKLVSVDLLGELEWSSVNKSWRSSPDSFFCALQRRVEEKSLAALPWSDRSSEFLERVRFWCRFQNKEDLEFWSELELARTVELWLAPKVLDRGVLDEDTLEKALVDRLEAKDAFRLERDTPTTWTAPSGSRKTILYTNQTPRIEVKLQEVFGLTKSPEVCGVKVQLLLLSPSQRPLQVTSDLESFWKNGYAEVRKEMRGRYPKHPWPEDPLTAEATNRTKPRPR